MERGRGREREHTGPISSKETKVNDEALAIDHSAKEYKMERLSGDLLFGRVRRRLSIYVVIDVAEIWKFMCLIGGDMSKCGKGSIHITWNAGERLLYRDRTIGGAPI